MTEKYTPPARFDRVRTGMRLRTRFSPRARAEEAPKFPNNCGGRERASLLLELCQKCAVKSFDSVLTKKHKFAPSWWRDNFSPFSIKSQRELVLITAQMPRNVTIVTEENICETSQLFYPTLRRSLIIPYKVIFVIPPCGGIVEQTAS